jgi:Flp pilus assembly protein TadG
MIRSRSLRRERSGAAALEFALVAGVFLPLCLAILDAGLLLWTKGALQSTASIAARCAAITSPDCTDAQQFAVTTAGSWIFPGIITKINVNPAPAVVCIASAPFMMVTITCQFWAGGVLPPPLNGKTLTSVAYFPVAAPPCA